MTNYRLKLMRLAQVLLLSWLTLGCACNLHSAPFKPVDASIVMNADTGYVYESHNCHALTYPASLTKMMTLYLLFEALEAKRVKLTTRMPVSHYATTQMPSKLGLQTGQTLTVLDAVMSLITKSANDASVVIAEHLGGSVEQFAEIMTRKAHYLKMPDTLFKNPNGVPNKLQRTTAHDMAKLAQALYKRFPNYYQYFRTKSFIYKGQVHKNHNKLLGICPGVDGIKTGYIAASGFNLAASAKRDGVRLIAIVMGGRTAQLRDRDIVKLLDKNFQVACGRNVDDKLLKSSESQEKYFAHHNSDDNQERQLNAFDELIEVEPVRKSQPKKLLITKNELTEKKALSKTQPFKKLVRSSNFYQVHVGRFEQVNLAKSTAKALQKKYNLGSPKTLFVSNKFKKQRHYHIHMKNLTQIQANKICQDKLMTNKKCKVLKLI